MARRRWTAWKLFLPNIRPYHIERSVDGYLHVTDGCEVVCTMTPTEARRLYTKLAADYRD